MRAGFSMLMALAIIVIISTVSLLVLNLSGKMVAKTSEKYRQEQAALLAQSYAELAILSVINQDINTSCITSIQSTVDNIIPNGTGSSNSESHYNVTIKISYIGNNLTACSDILNSTAISTDYNTTTPKGLAAILVDVFVRYRDSNINPNNDITYHLRRLNKI